MIWIESIVIEAAKELANLTLQTALIGGGKMLGEASKIVTPEAKKILFGASKKYIENYTQRHGILKVLGMRQPISIETIYTTVKLLDDNQARKLLTPQELETLYRNNNYRGFQNPNQPKQPGISLANKYQYLTILGGPGMGKSTFLRKMGLEALKGKKGSLQHTCMPVYLELKRFTSERTSIKDVIIKEFEWCDFPNAEDFVNTALKQGRLLILLDGLDEIPKNFLNQAIEKIQNFVDLHNKNRFIASCRTAVYQTRLRRFTDVLVADFDDAQINKFIQNWFHSPIDKQFKAAEKCWNLLQKPENTAAKELAQTPLLLTFLCIVYDRSQKLPDNRSVLYRKALNVLLEEWAAEKRLEQDNSIYQGLNTELEKVLLSRIAYDGFCKDQLFFSQNSIIKKITSFLSDTLDAPKDLNGKAVLSAIEVQQGILVERAEDVYSFSHLTLQEYLTANYLVQRPAKVDIVLKRYLTDNRWQEVIVLIAGLLPEGDFFLSKIEAQSKSYLDDSIWTALLKWADKIISNSNDSDETVARRAAAIALFLALSMPNNDALNLARSLISELTNYHDFDLVIVRVNAIPRSIARSKNLQNSENIGRLFSFENIIKSSIASIQMLASLRILSNINFRLLRARLEAIKLQIPNHDASIDAHHLFAEKLQSLWFSTLLIGRDITPLCLADIVNLRNYLNAISRMKQCQKASVRVSRTAWNMIEKRILEAKD